MDRPQSHALFARARGLMPGGVNSPVRAFRGVGGEPVFFKKGAGAWLTCVDGHRYVDYVGSWGPLILGHAHPAVVEAVTRAAKDGTSFGAPHPREVELAELMRELVPSLERMRLTSSGTEATMAALRLARGATGRKLILKFEGCYHGASDSLLVKAGSGIETLGLPDSPGVPPELARLTLTAPFNDLEAVEEIFSQHGSQLAAAIVEPVVGNMGVLIPKPGFLEGLRKLCGQHGTVLILDEVMTGFRLATGGAQARFGIEPDLSTFGKVIGGGLPVGAYGGKASLMSQIAPEGSIYQAGTLSGNPLAVAAGIACLNEIRKPGAIDQLEATSKALTDGIVQEAKSAGVPVTINRVGSMFTVFFTGQTDQPVFDATSARRSDAPRFGRFFHALLDQGVYLPPSQFESAFVSLAHGEVELRHTLEAVRTAFRALT